MKKGEHNGRPCPGDRGLYDYAEIEDTHGNRIRVRSSSSAEAVWIFTANERGADWESHKAFPGGVAVVAPHLNRAQARRLAEALLRFADGGK